VPLKRTTHWATRELHQHLLERATAAHEYGKNDCALFVADAIQAMTGVDIAEDFRGYTTQQGALAAIAKVTGKSTVEDAAAYCAKKYGLPELEHPLLAQRGDLVVVSQADGPGGLLLGLVHLSGACVVAPGDAGLRRIPLTAIKRAWRIG
jgi:hypothetical protein